MPIGVGIEINGNGDVELDDYAQGIVDDIEAGSTYGELEEEYGFTAYFLVAEAPGSVVMEDRQTIHTSEFDVQLASEAVEMIEEHKSYSNASLAKAAAGGLATAGTGMNFVLTGDPAWLTPSLILGYLSSDPARQVYEGWRAGNELEEEKDEAMDHIREVFEGVEGYEMEMKSADEMGMQVGASVEDFMQDLELPGPQDLDSGRGFQ